MRYCYCEKCKRVFPRNWYGRDHCEICRSTCEVIHVSRTNIGKLSFVFSGIAAIMLLLYILNDPLGVALFSFMGDYVGAWYNILLVFLLICAFVTAYIDLGRTRRMAESIIKDRDIS